MSLAVCLFSVPASFAFGAGCEDVSSEALDLAPPEESCQGLSHGPVRGRFAGMSPTVCLFPISKEMGFLLLADRAGGTEKEQNTTSPPLTQTHSDS
eukprot:1969701-Pyramimonas_sp.AAC.1